MMSRRTYFRTATVDRMMEPQVRRVAGNEPGRLVTCGSSVALEISIVIFGGTRNRPCV
jgi:hypothetical protein